ncbi:hypothetical protein [Aquipseudomonas alcaligenes]|uniref:hypothetical protein n=1 Tax=Aquipseudomonas alcaligenes TaxID=43263 RepID=UPI0035B3307C
MKQRVAMKEHILQRLKYDPQKGRQDYLDPPMPGQGTFGVRSCRECCQHRRLMPEEHHLECG